jgi:transcription antitermination factor NusA-like protein
LPPSCQFKTGGILIFKAVAKTSRGDEQVETQKLERLRRMLKVQIDRVEEKEGELVVYVPNDQAAKAIGAGGSVVRAAELILGQKLTIKGTTG